MNATFDLILDTARRLFDEHGYSATSVREIAEASGIAKATIYHHFPDKERILLTLLERGQAEQDGMIERLGAEKDPRRRIEGAVRESLGFLAANMGLMQAARRETVSGRGLVRERFLPGIARMRALVAEALSAGVAEGGFRKLDPERAASVLIAMIQGSYAGALLAEGRAGKPEDMVGAILEIFFDGISARKQEGSWTIS
jgi:TetR/AcrR family transcriptional regulator, cholesterol catabolism regulator